jgi:hypothetical protein
MTYGGNIVDAATNVTLNLICPAPAIAGTDYIMGDSDCRESRDPRMNFLATEWRAPGGGVDNSLNATNKQTLREWGQPGFGLVPNGWEGRDLDMVMHVANRPLQTVGELGNLYIGAHFETVRLYKHGNKATYGLVHRVLNYFTVDHPAGPASKGKVNLNTRDADVIRAVYADMPINAPAGNGMTKVTDSLLDDVVTAIEDVGLSGSQFASLAELGERINWAGIYPAGNDLEKESFVRNAVGLFGTRQNFFVIVLKAETTKSVLSQQGSNMVSVVSGVRAVAEVWRDPVADGTGFHPYFVRTFKILTE